MLVFSGTVVISTDSELATALGWPLCNGGILPAGVGEAINLTHRYFAAAMGVLLFYTLSETLRRHRSIRLLRRAAHTAVGLFARANSGRRHQRADEFPPFWTSLHLATAAAVLGAMFAFALIGLHVLGGRRAPQRCCTPGVNPNGQPYPPPASGR